MKRMRRNPDAEPHDYARGVEKYEEFHDREPRTVGTMRISGLPRTLYYAGRMIHTCYASDKWGGKTHNYIHNHAEDRSFFQSAGAPRIYVPAASVGTREASLPQWLANVKTFAKLGRCIELAFTDTNGDEWVAQGERTTELYTTPNGKALVVIEDKSRVEAVIWGGDLQVEARGIVH